MLFLKNNLKKKYQIVIKTSTNSRKNTVLLFKMCEQNVNYIEQLITQYSQKTINIALKGYKM